MGDGALKTREFKLTELFLSRDLAFISKIFSLCFLKGDERSLILTSFGISLALKGVNTCSE